jgi:hypothetical protein
MEDSKESMGRMTEPPQPQLTGNKTALMSRVQKMRLLFAIVCLVCCGSELLVLATVIRRIPSARPPSMSTVTMISVFATIMLALSIWFGYLWLRQRAAEKQ